MSSYADKTYIVFLDLPLEVQLKIDAIRKKYSIGGNKKWHSHITFKQDEDFLLSESEMKQQAAAYFSNAYNIELTLDGPKISYVGDDNWNIYIALSNTEYLKERIIEFSQSMYKFIDPESPRAFGSTEWEQGENFYPHISLKGGSGKEEGEKIFSEIISEDFKINFPAKIICESVTLAKWQIDKWQELSNIKLLGSGWIYRQ